MTPFPDRDAGGTVGDRIGLPDPPPPAIDGDLHLGLFDRNRGFVVDPDPERGVDGDAFRGPVPVVPEETDATARGPAWRRTSGIGPARELPRQPRSLK